MPKRKLESTDTRDGSPKRPSGPASDLVWANSSSSDSSLNYRAPCTSSEGRPCDIFRELRVWNEYFSPVGLELSERSPGQLFLVEMRGAPIASEVPERKHKAATLLRHLLRYHRCLVSVYLNGCIFNGHHQICDALTESASLRELNVCLPSMNTRVLQSVTAALPLQNQLRELEWRFTSLEQTFCEGLSEFLGSAVSLKTFILNAPVLMAHEGRIIFQGLKRNATITTLSLNAFISPYLRLHGKDFAEYLCENQTLRTLILATNYPNDHVELRLIMLSLCRTTSLSEVKLVGFRIDDVNSRAVALLLSKNESLRGFHMVNCTLYSDGYLPESIRTHPWLAAFRENKTLEKLTMELSCFTVKQCKSLFKALKSNVSLKNITVERLRPTEEAEVCRVMRETGVRERFFLLNPCIGQDPAVTRTGC